VKKVIWNKKAREFVRSLDVDARIEIGALLMMLQMGETLSEPQSKPMKTIHAKAHEIRIRNRKGAYRVIYVLITPELIIIPHAFAKKTQETPIKDINLSIKRIRELLSEVK